MTPEVRDAVRRLRLDAITFDAGTQREIAEQVGCHQSLVSRVYQNMSGSEPVSTGRRRKTNVKREAIRRLLSEGLSSEVIAKQVGVSLTRVSEVRVELGLSKGVAKSRGAVKQRKEQMIGSEINIRINAKDPMSYIAKYKITPRKLAQQFVEDDIRNMSHEQYESWVRARAKRLADEGNAFLESLREGLVEGAAVAVV